MKIGDVHFCSLVLRRRILEDQTREFSPLPKLFFDCADTEAHTPPSLCLRSRSRPTVCSRTLAVHPHRRTLHYTFSLSSPVIISTLLFGLTSASSSCSLLCINLPGTSQPCYSAPHTLNIAHAYRTLAWRASEWSIPRFRSFATDSTDVPRTSPVAPLVQSVICIWFTRRLPVFPM